MNKCIDCSKEISKYAVRCVICRNIYIAQNFVKGIPKSIKTKNILRKLALLRTPTRCGVKLSEIIKNKISKGLLNYYKDHISSLKNKSMSLQTKRKLSKTQTIRLKNPKNNPAYIDGRTLKTHYCICGKKLQYNTFRCKACWIKMRKIKYKGRNNPNYRHGQGNLPYSIEWNEQLKKEISNRDNNVCQICYKSEKSLKGHQKKLHIHHIDYNKFNCESSNLITLCLKCHLSTNGNRDYWYAYFRYITRTVC